MEGLSAPGQPMREFSGNKHSAHRIANRLALYGVRLASGRGHTATTLETNSRRPENVLKGTVQHPPYEDHYNHVKQIT